MLLRDVCLQWLWNVINGECYETLLKASKSEADFVLGRRVGMPSEKNLKCFLFFLLFPGSRRTKIEQKKRESKEPPLPVPNERMEWGHKHLSGSGEREDKREADRRGGWRS